MLNPASIGWLPAAPAEFRRICNAIDASGGSRGDGLRGLALHDLNSNQLHRLARSVSAALEAGAVAPLDPVKLGLVSNTTTDLLVAPLVGSGARYGLALSVEAAPFGVTLQAALDPQSPINRAHPDAILLALDHRAFFGRSDLSAEPEAELDAARAHMSELAGAFRAASGAVLLVQTLPTPPERLFGSLDRRQPGTLAWLIEEFNRWLARDVAGPGVILLDVAGLAAEPGTARWFDPQQWLNAKLSFAQPVVPAYADRVASLLAALRGKSRKVLVLDLDNTLWGGVIGDDGVEGVKLGQGDAAGEAFIELQRAALALKSRGILLALCSKNTESVALSAFRDHPEMLLKESDFSAFQINWSDKATNLETLSQRLSLGLDSFVFLDDNPFEREQVRQALPSVIVPELPSDPSTYARLLMSSGLFESVSFSAEDRDRSDLYAANAQRESVRAQSRDLDAYLRSLEMRACFVSGGDVGWQRFTQLINKSNQFNLTTRRYGDAEILALASDPDVLTLQARLVDRFGDNGMISCVICRPEGSDWLIDTWVMSCRVLGRRVEETVLNEIVRHARLKGVQRLLGTFKPTERNGLVRDHYARLGFEEAGSQGGITHWIMRVDGYVARDTGIETGLDA